MRIAQLVSASVINGAARHCLELSAALAERGHKVLVVHRPQLLVRIGHAGVTTLESDFARNPRALRRFAEDLALFGADVLHTHVSSAHSYGALLRIWRGAPVVATAHARHFQLHWPFNDSVIAPSRSTADYHRRVHGLGGRVEVIPNFVDCDATLPATPQRRRTARESLGLGEDALVIGSVGAVEARKRPSDLVRAARSVLEARPEAALVLVGGLEDEREVARVRLQARGIEDRVRLPGRREDARSLLAAFDLFALASASEEAPIAVLEAMAAGLPVISTDVGGLSEMVQDGGTGLLAPPRDVAAFAERLGRLAGDPALRQGMGVAGRRRAEAAFAAGPVVERIEAVLQAAADLRPGWSSKKFRPSPLEGEGSAAP
jgi:glycosyltransferase involved in cell wall biosynthesis